MLTRHTFDNREALAKVLADKVANNLHADIDRQGAASLMVSGGSTPHALFQALSQKDIPWHKVTIGLVDDRWVSPTHDSSNERLVTDHLLVNAAKAARFVGMKTADDDAFAAVAEVAGNIQDIPYPYTQVLLGMGTDGHSASLFPCSAQVEEGTNPNNPQRVIAVAPTTAPFQRMSLTLPAIVSAKAIVLQLHGDDKVQVLDAALSSEQTPPLPIKQIIDASSTELYWAP